jgi:hypothetical protein
VSVAFDVSVASCASPAPEVVSDLLRLDADQPLVHAEQPLYVRLGRARVTRGKPHHLRGVDVGVRDVDPQDARVRDRMSFR